MNLEFPLDGATCWLMNTYCTCFACLCWTDVFQPKTSWLTPAFISGWWNWKYCFSLQHHRYVGRTGDYRGTYIASEAPILLKDIAIVDPSDRYIQDQSYGRTPPLFFFKLVFFVTFLSVAWVISADVMVLDCKLYLLRLIGSPRM